MSQTMLVTANADNLADEARELPTLDAAGRVRWALEHLPGAQVLSSSFGMQAAVMLHLVTRIMPDIPVIFIDTGYHFAETYQFVDVLTDRLELNLRVFRAPRSPGWQEARHGQRWTHGIAGMNAYNDENKLEPMRRALDQLNVGTWFSGVRRSQSAHRRGLSVVETVRNRYKVNPLIDWSDRDVHQYLQTYQLPYHPLRDRGYVSIGDWHSTLTLADAGSEEQTRFLGLQRECGLHDRL